jgi:hypothetical protein
VISFAEACCAPNAVVEIAATATKDIIVFFIK